MDVSYIALASSVIINFVLAYKVLGGGVSTADVLADFKAAVVKVKAAKDKASVDSATLAAGIPQILDLLK